jgi:hypothetical protein
MDWWVLSRSPQRPPTTTDHLSCASTTNCPNSLEVNPEKTKATLAEGSTNALHKESEQFL